MVKIIYNKLLGGWFVVCGPHHAPLSGKFATKAEAQTWRKGSYGAHLDELEARDRWLREVTGDF